MNPWTDLLSAGRARWQDSRLVDFGQPAAERLALATACALMPLPSLATWRIHGADAASFLQGQTTNDVAALAPEQWQVNGYCNPKGRLLATFLLARGAPEEFLAILPATLGDPVFARLTRYVLRAKVQLAPAPLAPVGLAGPLASTVLAGAHLPCPQPGKLLAAGDAWVLGLGPTRFLMLVPHATLPALWSTLLSARAQPAGEALWDTLDIAAGLATVLPQTQEAFVPQMLNLDLVGGLSYDKGCYPGQEIVARMHYLGRLKERLYRASVAAPSPAAGVRLYSPAFGEQPCGTVVLASLGEADQAEFLAVLQVAAANSGAVHLGAPQGPRLNFLPLPYAVPEATLS